MLRFKIFADGDNREVERQVNTWLAQAEPDVKLMVQTRLPEGGITVSFLYDEGFMASEQRLSATAEASAIVESAMREPQVLEPLKVEQDQV